MAELLGGLTQTSWGIDRNDHWWAVPTTPIGGYVNVGSTLILQYGGDSTQDDPYETELQLADNTGFTSSISRLFATMTDGAARMEMFTGLTTGAMYYWRVRGKSPYGDWSPWSTTRSLQIAPLGAGSLTILMNVFAKAEWNLPVESDMNIGPALVNDGTMLTGSNIGPLANGDDTMASPVDVGLRQQFDSAYNSPKEIVVATPLPYIWILIDEYGRDGDGFKIVGHGFGSNQAQYSGQPLWLWAEGDEAALPIVTWDSIPPSPNAYTDARVIDVVAKRFDPAHQEVGVIVPLNSVPPGYWVRIRTDGP